MDGRVQTSMWLPPDLLREARKQAIDEGRPFYEIVERALREYLKKSRRAVPA